MDHCPGSQDPKHPIWSLGCTCEMKERGSGVILGEPEEGIFL